MNFYAELLRGVRYRDDNFKPLGSNDPSLGLSSWVPDGGGSVGLSVDGDLLSVAGTDATHGVANAIAGAISTTTSPFLVVRALGTGSLDVQVNYISGSPSTFTIALTPLGKTFSLSLPTGRVLNTIRFLNQSVPGSNKIDRVAACSQAHLQLSATDLFEGSIARAAFGFDNAQLRLNNLNGKYVTGANSWGFGDHLHIYLPRQGDASGTLYHAYGGYAEIQEPFQPNDEINIYSRGWGIGLGRTLYSNQDQNKTPQVFINDMLDNRVNFDTIFNTQAIAQGLTNVPTNYQLTRSFVQNIGASLPVYVAVMKNCFDTMRELADLSTAGAGGGAFPAVFFVDPAENVHWVPLGAQGLANWGTDPIPALYGMPLAVGVNQITNQFRRDTQSIRNRVHYHGVAQSPGIFDAWTEYSTDGAVAANWDQERANANTTVQFHSSNTIVGLGHYSTFIRVTSAGSASQPGAAFFYPKAKNLGLNIASMGSSYAPPLFDFCFRFVSPSPLNLPAKIFFATDATNRFEYDFVEASPNPASQSFMNTQGLNNLTQNYWFHMLLPIGPNGGTLFLNPPSLNGIATATYTGTSGYQLSNVGSPDWKNINYIGFDTPATGAQAGGNNYDWYLDGWRILGGRYRIAYDNRTAYPLASYPNARYPDMSEVHIWDPISKDESMIKSLAKAELLRLRNPIMRGSIHVPVIGDLYPEQQVLITSPSAGLTNTYLRVTELVHHFSQNGMITEVSLSDDFVNSQPLERFKILNSIMGMGENAILSREMYDLKTALIDPGFTPVLDPYT